MPLNPTAVRIGSRIHRFWYRATGGRVGATTSGAGEERARLWPKLVGLFPGYEGYQEEVDRTISVVILTPDAG